MIFHKKFNDFINDEDKNNNETLLDKSFDLLKKN